MNELKYTDAEDNTQQVKKNPCKALVAKYKPTHHTPNTGKA